MVGGVPEALQNSDLEAGRHPPTRAPSDKSSISLVAITIKHF